MSTPPPNLYDVLRSELGARNIERTPLPHAGLTVSIGVMSHDGGAATALPALLKAADDALYRAKNEGRNRVVEGADPADRSDG